MHINKQHKPQKKIKNNNNSNKTVSAQDGATALAFAKANPSRLYSSLEVQAVINALKQVRVGVRIRVRVRANITDPQVSPLFLAAQDG